MKKLWLSALTAATLVTGMSVGTAARADGWHGHGHGHGHHRDRYERCDDRRYYGPPRHTYYRPYREVREVYYAPPRYYAPAPVYYGGRGYRNGVSGSITVDF